MTIVKELVQKIIEEAILKAVNDGKFEGENLPSVKVEYPKEEKFGDYSTPFALESAKILRKSPFDIGNIIKEYIEENEIVKTVDVVRPGFVNIFIAVDFLKKILMEVHQLKDKYGLRKKENPKKVNIEFVSANPTGPLNVVSARAAALGDTIATLKEASGDIVHREFYVNDFGNQVRLLGLSTYLRYKELKGEAIEFPEDGYHGGYVKDIAQLILDEYEDEISTKETEDELVDFFSVKAVEKMKAEQKRVMGNFNVDYKTWFSERTLHEDGTVDKTLEFLKSKEVVFEEEGKQFFNATAFGDDKDRVIVRDDGRPTYLLADIAYHKNKFERGYDEVIDIWGPDHHGYIARVKGAIKAMGFDEKAFRVLIAQQVNLLMDGEQVKMSKRLGQFSTMQELIDEIGVDVSRYFFIMRSLESHLDFDLNLAKKQSSENPVFYLQYAHARICSIFREAENRNIKLEEKNIHTEPLNNSETITLLKRVAKFPEEIIDAADNCEPHRIANYLLTVAQSYHKFYTVHRVLTDDLDKTSTYLGVCDAVRTVIKNGLALLGVSAPERM